MSRSPNTESAKVSDHTTSSKDTERAPCSSTGKNSKAREPSMDGHQKQALPGPRWISHSEEWIISTSRGCLENITIPSNGTDLQIKDFRSRTVSQRIKIFPPCGLGCLPRRGKKVNGEFLCRIPAGMHRAVVLSNPLSEQVFLLLKNLKR